MRAAAVALGTLVLVGCGSAEPILFAGTLEDELGMPVPGATVVVEAYEEVDGQAGQAPPVAFRAETRSGADGRFEIRLAPNDQLRQLYLRNRGPLSFMAIARKENLVWAFPFVREIGRDGWTDTFTPVRWRPGP